MSASAGDVKGQAAQGADEKNRGPPETTHAEKGQVDPEKGDPNAEDERNRSSDDLNEDDVYNESDEYTRLLKYIDLEAKKSRRGGDEGGDDEEEGEMKRVWYMPWKKRRVSSQENQKVPHNWLETDMLKGLSEEEITKRRGKFGYNELERFVFCRLAAHALLTVC